MSGMFYKAEKFNQNLENWDFMNLTNMNSIFQGVTSYNQDIFKLIIPKETDTTCMFEGYSASLQLYRLPAKVCDEKLTRTDVDIHQAGKM